MQQWPFCHQHRRQGWATLLAGVGLLFVTMPAVLSSYAGLWRDAIEPALTENDESVLTENEQQKITNEHQEQHADRIISGPKHSKTAQSSEDSKPDQAKVEVKIRAPSGGRGQVVTVILEGPTGETEVKARINPEGEFSLEAPCPQVIRIYAEDAEPIIYELSAEEIESAQKNRHLFLDLSKVPIEASSSESGVKFASRKKNHGAPVVSRVNPTIAEEVSPRRQATIPVTVSSTLVKCKSAGQADALINVRESMRMPYIRPADITLLGQYTPAWANFHAVISCRRKPLGFEMVIELAAPDISTLSDPDEYADLEQDEIESLERRHGESMSDIISKSASQEFQIDDIFLLEEFDFATPYPSSGYTAGKVKSLLRHMASYFIGNHIRVRYNIEYSHEEYVEGEEQGEQNEYTELYMPLGGRSSLPICESGERYIDWHDHMYNRISGKYKTVNLVYMDSNFYFDCMSR